MLPLIDYHIHERRSRDALTTSIPEYIKVAEERGITEIAFTNHLITEGLYTELSIKLSEIPEYIEEIRQAQAGTKVRLLAGLEVDYFPEEERHLETIISEHDFDFILGSTHFINGVYLGSKTKAEKFFINRSISKSADEYYTTWGKAVESGLFDVMAHPDYWRKYLHFYGKSATWQNYGSVVFEALEKAAKCGVGIEVNTAGIIAGTGHFYPIPEFLLAAHEAGIEIVTVGSDSHTAGALGFKAEEAAKRLYETGFTSMSTFKGRRNKKIPIDDILKKHRP